MKNSSDYIKYVSIFAFLFLGFFSLPASAQQVITLRESIELAQKNNLQVKQALFQAALTEQDVKQAKMNFYPRVNAGMDGNLRWGKSFDQLTGGLTESITSLNGSVNASVPIFQGFQRVNEVAANKYLLLADQTNTERIQSDLVLAVVTTYLEALTNQDLLTAGKQQLTLSKEQLQAEEINFDVGNRTLADLSQAKRQVATDELNVTSARNEYDISILDLKQLMELDPSTEIVLEQPPLPEFENITTAYSAEEVYLEAKSIYPEIKQASYNTLAAEKNIDIVKGGYYPTLSLSGGLGSGYSSADKDYTTGVERPFHQQIDDNFSTFVGLSLSIPIFNNFQTRIAVKKA